MLMHPLFFLQMCAKYRILFLLSLSPEGSPFLWRPISQLKFKTQKHKNTKLQKHKNAKTQNVVCNAQIINAI